MVRWVVLTQRSKPRTGLGVSSEPSCRGRVKCLCFHNTPESSGSLKVEERLADLTADLVEYEENSVFLERLFSLKAGVWEDVTTLCRGLVHLEDDMAQLQRSSKGGLRVTWLGYPASTHGKGYCLIIFFAEELHWGNVALYNKRGFSQKFGRRVRTAK